jgi:hypothetical protein
MKTRKQKAKKAIKQNRTASARQVSARRRIGCPGVGMFKMKDLEPAGYNPREIDAEALEGLTNSISRFGCVEPIVVNTRGRKNVIVGHRVTAMNRCPTTPTHSQDVYG